MTDSTDGTVVLGAGLTGLSFAFHYGTGTPIYERESEPGGLVRSLLVRGCSFDLAPHLLHLRSEYVRKLVFETLGLEAAQVERKARIYCDGRLISYPFELNLHGLSEQMREDCLRGLDTIAPHGPEHDAELRTGSYEDYALNTFGAGISRHYLLPYNRKIWDTPPRDMTCEWMRFLPAADAGKIRRSAYAPSDEAFGYNSAFYYPRRRGIRELPDAFAQRLPNIHFNKEVVRIQTTERCVHFSDGTSVHYEKLISTLPLNRLVALSDLPQSAQRAADLLEYTTVYTINMVVRGAVPEGVHWIYFPDPEYTFYRISLPKNFFPRATPGDEQILAVEVGCRRDGHDWSALVSRVERQVRDLGVFDLDGHCFTHCEKLPVAYCIYDKQRTPVSTALLHQLASLGIYSTGRYGTWEYSAMEDAILHGKTLAESLRAGG
ncbi:MAG: FAD-dependent oxidoreductase [Candidatus Hydrogenedentes bacterium]|nr:FAD-dependent oxidoreductase [Candidatus Hydrogenedentota bacterium]